MHSQDFQIRKEDGWTDGWFGQVLFFIISIIKFPRQRRRKKQVDVKQQMNGQQRDFPLLIRKRLIILVGEIHRVTLEQ